MPQAFNYEDERIQAIVAFRGLRKYKFLRWIPFVTGQQPEISLTVYLKQSEFEVESITIECDAPVDIEYKNSRKYAWCADDVRLNKEYEVPLPTLDRTGNYEYRLNVKMKYESGSKGCSIHSIGRIMNTGYVYWQENIRTHPS